MKYLFFDLETTGLRRDSDILEFGGLLFNNELKLIKVLNTYYNCDDIPASAINVHGLTPIKLQMFNAVDWESDAEYIFDLVAADDVILCGHNIISYDIPVLVSNLERSGFSLDIDKLKVIDTMRQYADAYPGSKSLSAALATAAKANNSSIAEVKSLFQSSTPITNKIADKSAFFHNALFDAFSSYIIYVSLLR